MTKSFILAGFGGQGILFAGRQLAACGMAKGYNVSWLPSYGPEMRGGTCNCSVIISDEEIGSPIVTNPNYAVVFNLPSFDKFEPLVQSRGTMFVDSTLVNKISWRDDISGYYIPATKLAEDNGLVGGANVVMLGKVVAATRLFTRDEFLKSMAASIPASKAELMENNTKAFDIGMGYK
ncbi:MAG: 2-oxoacid:ferredoxin oxidoreductase subunit gamma [Clostridiales bacterium]|jgi:2-oxoglutarate ferredoxin oxidoreductase subunit gamma|nr:2-oxoacid:ferredoxin oxidoreductase subunit gamma [Clostridiales bacterium]